MRIALITLACVASLAVMVWAAVPPHASPARTMLAPAQAALSGVADWYRSGPADGHPDWEAASRQVLLGDAVRGADLMVLHGCGSCHSIPGITGARGSVGPPLAGFADRSYVAGILPNRPGELTRWLMDPPAYAPDTAMPDMGIPEDEARDMAAYLYLLRGS